MTTTDPDPPVVTRRPRDNFADPNQSGARLDFTAYVSDCPNVNWIQFVETTHPATGLNSPYVDHRKDRPADFPLLDPTGKTAEEATTGGIKIHDDPIRDVNAKVDWKGVACVVCVGGRELKDLRIVKCWSWGWHFDPNAFPSIARFGPDDLGADPARQPGGISGYKQVLEGQCKGWTVN